MRIPWNKGRKETRQEVLEKLSNSRKGIKHTEEWKKAASLWMKGKKNSLGTHYKMSDETKAKISESRKGIKFSSEQIENMRKANLGKKQSKETIEKRSAKLRGSLSVKWKGDEVGYRGLHLWVAFVLGKPETCESCGKKGRGHGMHWANLSGEYLRKVEDWIRLCPKCHSDFDRNRI